MLSLFIYAALAPFAASDRDGEIVDFYEAPPSHFGMGSLGPQFGTEPVSVAARSLDRILAEESIACVDILKVDVEGFEAAVFRGAQQLLNGSSPPLVVFEFCDWAEARSGEPIGTAQRVLTAFGYRIYRCRDFLSRVQRPAPCVITSGFVTLVAIRDLT